MRRLGWWFAVLGAATVGCGHHRPEGVADVDAPHNDDDCTAASVVVGAEHDFDTPIISVPGANALDPSIAFDGTNYLVVWTDWRTSGSFSDIWGARVDGNGNLVDANSFPIAELPGTQQHPTVVFDGTRFVVAWEDFGAVSSTTSIINSAAVSPGGVVTQLGAINDNATSQTWPALAATPDGKVIAAWVASSQIYTSYVGQTTPATAITTNAFTHAEPALAVAPNGKVLVAYSERTTANQDDIRGQFLAADGSAAGSSMPISTGVSRTISPAVAYAGGNFVVAFVGYSTGVDIYGTRVDASGNVLDHHVEAGTQVGGTLLAGATGYQELPSIACASAADCMIAWQDTRNSNDNDIYAVHLDAGTFATVGSQQLVSAAPHKQTRPKLATTGSSYLAVWLDAKPGGDASQRVGGSRLSTTGAVLDPDGLVLDRGYNFQQFPSITATKNGPFVGWNDSRNLAGDDILMAMLDTTGAPVLPQQVAPVSAAPYTQQDTSVTAIGDNVMFAWRDYRGGGNAEIRVARARGDSGAILDPDGIVVAGPDAWDHPVIASSDSEAFVTWVHSPSNALREVWGARVAADGTAGTPFLIGGLQPENDRPSVDWDPATQQFVVVWHAGHRTAANEIRAARIARDGTLLDPGGVVVATSQGRVANARIAFVPDGTGLVVYQNLHDLGQAANRNIYAVRITAGEQVTVLDTQPTILTTQLDSQASPDVTAVADAFFVSWTDTSQDNPDIWGQRVAATGQGLGPPFAIAASAEAEDSAVVAGLDATNVLVAYRVHRNAIDAARVVTRVVNVPACVVLR